MTSATSKQINQAALAVAIAAAVKEAAFKSPGLLNALGDLARFAELLSVRVGDIQFWLDRRGYFNGHPWAEVEFSAETDYGFSFRHYFEFTFHGEFQDGQPVIIITPIEPDGVIFGVGETEGVPDYNPETRIVHRRG
jgi:hypothetical protein